MASLKVKVKDSNGNCCCGLGACVLFCSSRGGQATLCGVPEFLSTTPSVPPKKYLTATHKGSPFVCVYFQSDCHDPTGPGTVDSYDYDGSDPVVYDKDTCSVNTAHYTHNQQTGTGLTCAFGGGSPTVELQTVPPPGPASSTDAHGSITRSLTNVTVSYDSSICTAQSSFFITISGSETWDLTNEDTELNAIKRIPGINIWGDYVSCSSTPVCCRTAWQLRGAGEFAFEYVESRLEARVSNLPHNTGITVKVDILRRPYNAGVYTLYQTIENDGTSDATGFVEIDLGVMNNTEGFETIASNCRASLTNP